jgi:hypothetical protein
MQYMQLLNNNVKETGQWTNDSEHKMDRNQLNLSAVTRRHSIKIFLSKCLENRKTYIGHNMYVSFSSTAFVRNTIRAHM